MLIWLLPILAGACVAFLIELKYVKEQKEYVCFIPPDFTKPFSVAGYLDHMEKENLDILEHREPVDKEIILWWGMDGLRMNEDGNLEWISRKKKEPGPATTLYPMYLDVTQSLATSSFSISDSLAHVRDRIDQLNSQNLYLQTQLNQQMQNSLMVAGCCSRPLSYLPPGAIGLYSDNKLFDWSYPVE